MNRRALLGALWVLMFSSAVESLAEGIQPVFRIGVAPHTSARVIVEMYQPLRKYLEVELSREVEVVTAGDFLEFAERAQAQQYDLVITTGHQARLLQKDSGYIPLLTYQSAFRAVVLVAESSSYRRPVDLSGSTVFGLSEASLVTLWGKHWLQKHGAQNIGIRYVSAADSVAQAVLQGDGSAAFTSLANFQSLAPDVRAGLRILEQSAPMAGRVYLLNGRDANLRGKLDRALWAFSKTQGAATYFAKYELGGYRKLGATELSAMEPYAAEVRRLLQQKKNMILVNEPKNLPEPK